MHFLTGHPARNGMLLLAATLVALPACQGALHRPSPSAAPSTSFEAPPPRQKRITDAYVAGIALVANNVEIAYAALAESRAADPDVKSYAARMATDHTSLNATLTDLLARLDLDARDDPAGLALRDASIAHRARLRALSGRDFEVAYLDVDLASHRDLLDLIDQVLAPHAGRRELREYMAALRPVVSAHLAHAEQLRATLAARR